MSRIVLAVDANRNRKLLYAFLSAYHSVAEHASGRPLDEPFDLCFVDGPSLRRFQKQLEARREQEQPGILPVLLSSGRRDVWARIPILWIWVVVSIQFT